MLKTVYTSCNFLKDFFSVLPLSSAKCTMADDESFLYGDESADTGADANSSEQKETTVRPWPWPIISTCIFKYG